MNKRSIRILQFTSVINKNDFIDTIIRFSDRRHYEFVAVRMNPVSNIQEPEYKDIQIPCYNLNEAMSLKGMLFSVFKLARIIRREHPDLIHAHHYYESIIATFAVLLSFRKCRLIIGRHYHDELLITTRGLKLKMYLWFENLANLFATLIVVPSTDIVRLLKQSGVPAAKIRLIPYGFDFTAEKYQQADEEKLVALRSAFLPEGQNPVIVNIARHSRVKGQLYLIKAFHRFLEFQPNARLILVGDGDMHAKLKEQVEILSLSSSIIFAGWRKDALDFIDLADVLIHPTLQEAFPQIMIETMAKSCLLMVTPVSGANDVVQHLKNGYILPDNKPESIFQALQWLMSDKERARLIADQGKKDVYDNYDIRVVVKNFEHVYQECANEV